MNVKRVMHIDDLTVQVERKRMKSIRLKVTPLGEVRVSAPVGIADEEIKTLVESRKDWIYAQRKAFSHSPQAQAERATKEEREKWRRVVEACVPALVTVWEPLLGVKVNTLAYRDMRSRWGSCQPSNARICINTRLALYPPECLEYVVVHEMCHLLVPNHGEKFKELLDGIMPDWRHRAEKLRA